MFQCYSYTIIRERINSCLLKLQLLKQSIKIHQCVTSIYQPTNAHIISHKKLLKHFKTLRHVLILSDHHQGALFLAKSYVTVFTIQFVFANEVSLYSAYDAHLASTTHSYTT